MRQVGVSIRSHLGSTCWHYTVTFSLVRVSVSSKQLKDGCLYHLRGKQDLALKLHCCFFGLFLHCLPIPSLPWLAVVSAYSFELRESHEGWMMPRSGGHRKAFVPIIPAGSCSISIPGKVSCLRQGCSKENCTLLPSVWNNTACWTGRENPVATADAVGCQPDIHPQHLPHTLLVFPNMYLLMFIHSGFQRRLAHLSPGMGLIGIIRKLLFPWR